MGIWAPGRERDAAEPETASFPMTENCVQCAVMPFKRSLESPLNMVFKQTERENEKFRTRVAHCRGQWLNPLPIPTVARVWFGLFCLLLFLNEMLIMPAPG